MTSLLVWLLLILAGPPALHAGFKYLWKVTSRWFQKIHKRFHDWLDTWDAVIEDDDDNNLDNQEK